MTDKVRTIFCYLLLMLCLFGHAGPAVAADSAVIFMYHRVGQPATPSTNIHIAQFEAHLEELATGSYSVLALADIIDALQKRVPLPERTVALTFDDAYLSIYTEAWPRLKAAGLPATLFIATDFVDQNIKGYLSWDQIREMVAEGLDVGSQTASHPHLPELSLDVVREELNRSNAKFITELGRPPALIAYPYGEASLEVMEISKQAGFTAGFGQHSGVAHASQGFFYLPRFAMNERYGDIERFRLAANALPIKATDITPADPVVGALNPPPLGFTVPDPLKGLANMNCFASHVGAADVQIIAGTRVEIRVNEPFPKGRTRLNCTILEDQGRWRWLGRQFFVPRR